MWAHSRSPLEALNVPRESLDAPEDLPKEGARQVALDQADAIMGRDADETGKIAGRRPEPAPGSGLRSQHDRARVHVPVPADRPAGLRDHQDSLRPRPAPGGAEIAQALSLVVPGRG